MHICYTSNLNYFFSSCLRYKIAIEVEFDNHVGCFVFWDKDCIPFLEMIARELRQLVKAVSMILSPLYHFYFKVYIQLLFQCIFYLWISLERIIQNLSGTPWQTIKQRSSISNQVSTFFQQYSIVAVINDIDVIKTLNDYLNPNKVRDNSFMISTFESFLFMQI